MGYVAFVLGVFAFMQKSDGRLKFFNASQCLAYTVHFALLGNFSAASSALISSARSFLALRYRSLGLAVSVLALNLVVGWLVAKTALGWVPVLASCIATVAVFKMQGVALRLALLTCTFLWLVNNIASGSIGGTLLECFIAVANITTISRMRKAAKRAGESPD